jgi:hypothetical protein
VTNKRFYVACTAVVVLSSVLLIAYFLKAVLWFLGGLTASKWSLRGAMALTGRIVWWAVLVIGVLTMLVLMFGERDGPRFGADGLAEFMRLGGGPRIYHPVTPGEFLGVLEFLGYVFSLTGFATFVGYCYVGIETYVETRVGALAAEYILEVAGRV